MTYYVRMSVYAALTIQAEKYVQHPRHNWFY